MELWEETRTAVGAGALEPAEARALSGVRGLVAAGKPAPWRAAAAGLKTARRLTARLRLPGARWSAAAATLALLGAGGLAVLPASPAQADTGDIIAPSDPDNPQVDSGWQAGTCREEPPESPDFCSVDTKEQFFEQAGGHPPFGFTQFIVKYDEPLPGLKDPVGELKTVRVDLPPGLTVNPQATPQCPQATFEADPEACDGSEVGESLVTASVAGVPTPLPGPPPVVYNIEPPQGEPARFGFQLLGNNIYLEADVAWESDYHEGFTIHVPETPFAKALEFGFPALQGGVVLQNRLVFRGNEGPGTFITTPTTCLGEATPSSPFKQVYSTWLLASSIEEGEEPGYSFPESARPSFESRIPPETSPKDCDTIPFDPSIAVEPNTAATDSPAGATVTVDLPEIQDPAKEEKQASSYVRSARVTLPAGMGLNPSAANGLVACTDEQFGKGTRLPVTCPEASRIGTVEVDTPPLPDGSISGPVYVGRQLSRDPTSGQQYRIFVDAGSPRYDISARLLGKVSANPLTGQLTTTFDDAALGSIPLPGLPQVPFKSFRVKFNGGARAPLTSPPTCGPSTTTTQMTPWSSAQGSVPVGEEGGPSGNPPASRSGGFALTALPGGGACPKTMAERPFAPGFGAQVANPQAGAFSDFSLDMTRSDGNQELKGATVTLSPGLTAKLAGLSYCPEAAIAAAEAGSGAAEAASPSCPASSLVGSASVFAGTGPEPLHVDGRAFLAGPYHGAPLSLAIVTPATAGPFDLGSVVVRVALFVDPATAQVRAVSDLIPHVFGGALLDVRSIAVDLNRSDFSLNPTNCSPMSVAGTLLGGGGNPADPAAFSALPVSAPFQVSGCDKLGFKPRLFLRLYGATRRARNPKLRAVFVTRPGDANPARVAVTLPHALFLDQSSISKVCTRVQFSAGACPQSSIYGHARAFTPLLDKPLEGPVYLRSSDNPLPDLVAALRGQVNIDLAGRTDSVKGRIRNTFDVIPDVPVSKFVLTVRGGSDGLLVNSRNLCPRKRGHRRKPLRAVARIKGQNGKTANRRPKLRTPCGKRKRRQRPAATAGAAAG